MICVKKARDADTENFDQAVSNPFQHFPWQNGFSLPFGICFCAVPVLHSWDFNTSGNSEDWMPINGLSNFGITDGFLKTHIIGTDPYMFSPKNLSSETFRYSSIVIRMKLRYGEQAEFFWTATGQSDFMAGFEMPFALKPDGEFHAC